MLRWVAISNNVSLVLYTSYLLVSPTPLPLQSTLDVRKIAFADEAVLLRLDFNGVLTAWRQKEDEHGQTEQSVLAQGGI